MFEIDVLASEESEDVVERTILEWSGINSWVHETTTEVLVLVFVSHLN